MASQQEPTAPDSDQTLRLDKWLWFARVAKTRTLSAGLVSNGRVRVNRERVTKPSHIVRAGDVITVSVARGVRVLKIEALGVRRGPANEAAGLYDEIVPLTTRRSSDAAMQRPDGMTGHPLEASINEQGPVSEVGSGRPTKRDRRQIDRLRDR